MNHQQALSLDALSRKYVLDKHVSTNWHNYIPSYTKLFEPIRKERLQLLEIGIGVVEQGQMVHVVANGYVTGNSLRCWQEYFPNASIYGMDIFSANIVEPRIKTFVADQSNEEHLKFVMEQIPGLLNIVIDDGSHRPEHQAFTFMVLSKYMAQGSIYVIEDIQYASQQSFRNLSIFPTNFQDYVRKYFEVESFDTGHSSPCNDDFMIAFHRKRES